MNGKVSGKVCGGKQSSGANWEENYLQEKTKSLSSAQSLDDNAVDSKSA